MQMKIDGEECRVEIGRARGGWVDVFRMGPTQSGRIARLSRHIVPESLITSGGKVRTGGHVYEVRT